MGKRCEKCAGKPFCSCPKGRPKDRPPEKWRSPRRDRVKTHDWSPWARCPREIRNEKGLTDHYEPGNHDVKICSRCGRARARKHVDR